MAGSVTKSIFVWDARELPQSCDLHPPAWQLQLWHCGVSRGAAWMLVTARCYWRQQIRKCVLSGSHFTFLVSFIPTCWGFFVSNFVYRFLLSTFSSFTRHFAFRHSVFFVSKFVYRFLSSIFSSFTPDFAFRHSVFFISKFVYRFLSSIFSSFTRHFSFRYSVFYLSFPVNYFLLISSFSTSHFIWFGSL
jgi:hypothetical protein